MRILHTSDWHLGRTLHGADLTPAFNMWCRHVIDVVRERQIDALLISGDVYDRGIPPARSVALFNSTLAELAEHTQVILTSGNHDSPVRLGFGASLMNSHIHIRTLAAESGIPVEVTDAEGNLALIYPIPYLDPDMERGRLAEALGMSEPLPRSHEAVVGAAMELVRRDLAEGTHAGETATRIVMAHAFVTGGEPSESERDIAVGGVDGVPSGLFRVKEGNISIDYVALGHLHSAQQVGTPADPPMRYSGTPIAFSFSETKAKSSVLIEASGDKVTTELIPAPIWRGVHTLTGTIAELESRAGTVPDASFSRVIVTDDARPANLKARIDAIFPHVLELQHRPAVTRKDSDSVRLDVAASPPLEILREFMELAGNAELTDDAMDLLSEVWEHVRKEAE